MKTKKAEKQLDDTWETLSVSGGNTSNDRANTAWKNDNNSSINSSSSSSDDDDDGDIESDNGSTNTGETPVLRRKNWFSRRLTLADAIKVVALWGIIVTVALLAGRGSGSNNLASTDNSTCSLCSTGTSVRDPDLEIVVADFAFQCNDPSRAPRVNTCGEVERLAIESSSQCSDGDSDSCTEFQQAASQCCFLDVDDIFSDVP